MHGGERRKEEEEKTISPELFEDKKHGKFLLSELVSRGMDPRPEEQ